MTSYDVELAGALAIAYNAIKRSDNPRAYQVTRCGLNTLRHMMNRGLYQNGKIARYLETFDESLPGVKHARAVLEVMEPTATPDAQIVAQYFGE